MSKGAGGGEGITPINQNDQGVKTKIHSLIEAITIIERYYYFEKKGNNISPHLLALDGSLAFFNVGYFAAIREGLFFLFCVLLSLPFQVDPWLMEKAGKVLPMLGSPRILWWLNVVPVGIYTVIYSYLARFYHVSMKEKSITKRAIDSLLVGRLTGLFSKALILFFVFVGLSNHIHPEWIWKYSRFFGEAARMRIYTIVMEMKPALFKWAFESWSIFFMGVCIMFMLIWGAAWKRRIRAHMNKRRWESDKPRFSLIKAIRKAISLKRKIDIGIGKSIEDEGYIPNDFSVLYDLELLDSYRNSHLMVNGTTRVGKSVFLGHLACQDIEAGNSVVICDPKGDIPLLTTIVQKADECGRLDDLIVVSPIFPELSARIDPLAYTYVTEERVNHLVAALDTKDGKSEVFFLNVAYEVCFAIVNGLEILEDYGAYTNVINISTVNSFCTYADLERLRDELLIILHHAPERIKEAIDAINRILTSPAGYFAEVSNSLRTVLMAMSMGIVGKIIGKADSNEFVRRLERNKPVILVVQTGSMITKRTAHMVARTIVSMIQSHVARRLAVGKKCTPKLCLYLDEAAKIMYPGIQDMFSMAGAADCYLHVFTQSMAQYVEEIGEDATRSIMDCTNTKIYMRLVDNDTCDYVSDTGGTIARFDQIISSTGSVTVREVEKERIKPEHVRKLQKREIFMFSYDGMFHGKTAACRVPGADELIRYPEVDVS